MAVHCTSPNLRAVLGKPEPIPLFGKTAVKLGGVSDGCPPPEENTNPLRSSVMPQSMKRNVRNAGARSGTTAIAMGIIITVVVSILPA